MSVIRLASLVKLGPIIEYPDVTCGSPRLWLVLAGFSSTNFLGIIPT